MWKLAAALVLLTFPAFAVSAPVVPKCQFVNGVPAASGSAYNFTISTSSVVSGTTPPAAPNGGILVAIMNANNPFEFRPSTDGTCPGTLSATALDGTGFSMAPSARALKALSNTAINILCLGSVTANTKFSVEYCEQ